MAIPARTGLSEARIEQQLALIEALLEGQRPAIPAAQVAQALAKARKRMSLK